MVTQYTNSPSIPAATEVPASRQSEDSERSNGDQFSPPSYDFVTSTSGPSTEIPGAGDSTSSHPVPEHLAHLFNGPPNAEALLGRGSVPLAEVSNIVTSKRNRGQAVQTWDPRLSSAGALYDFLRQEALTPPSFRMRLFGAHWEDGHVSESVVENGVSRRRNKGQKKKVVDFDFFIDLTPLLTHEDSLTNVHLYSSLPDATVHRGTHLRAFSALYAPSPRQTLWQAIVRYCSPYPRDFHDTTEHYQDHRESSDDVKLTDPGRTASHYEKRLHYKFSVWKAERGLPSWIGLDDELVKEFWESRHNSRDRSVFGLGPIRLAENHGGHEDRELLDDVETGGLADRQAKLERARTKPALRDWCDTYCVSPGLLKEFHMLKSVWGWDMAGLKTAVRGAISSTGYISNECTVTFEVSNYRVTVMPDNSLSKALGRPFIYALAWLTLIYPIIWICQRLHSRGGAKWDVARASYAFKFYPPLPETYPGESIKAAQSRLPTLYKLHPEIPRSPILQKGPKGVHYLVGRKEGEWFREWEDRIRMGVKMRYKGELEARFERGEAPRLDGY